MIEWKPSLSVGVDEIDAQHQELFRRAGLFVQSLASRSRQDVGILLSFLRLYCVSHFGAEEAWMRESDYPGAAAHKKEHDGFIKELLLLTEQHEKPRGKGLEPARVAQWVETWLVEHVSGSDTELARHLKACGLPELAGGDHSGM